MVKIDRIKNIEFLRFIFALIIVLCHFRHGIINCFYDSIPFYAKFKVCLRYSHIPVDFFFIISSFFMFLLTDFSKNFVDFAKNKLIRFLPLVIFSLMCWFVGSLILPMKFHMAENVFTILNIQCIGLTFRNGDVPASWLISALFWGMCIHFYLFKNMEKRWYNFFAAMVVYLGYAFLLHSQGQMTRNCCYIINRGLVRALSGLGVGYFISMLYENKMEAIKRFVPDIKEKIFITLAEVYLFSYLIFNTCMHKMNYNNVLIFIVTFSVLFILFIARKGWFSRLLENDFSVFLGQFAFAIFLTHQFVIKLWNIFVCKGNPNFVLAHPYLNLVLLLITVILFGGFSHYKVEVPVTKFLKNRYQ